MDLDQKIRAVFGEPFEVTVEPYIASRWIAYIRPYAEWRARQCVSDPAFAGQRGEVVVDANRCGRGASRELALADFEMAMDLLISEGIRAQWPVTDRRAQSESPSDRAGGHGPRIVCLCGSTRFRAAFERATLEEELAGKVVLATAFADSLTLAQKDALDELHRRKIDLADEVLVLNVDGYVGESTRSEIAYATVAGKTIRYLVRPS